MKISKFDATRCHIFDIRWGSAPDPAGGAYSAPPELANPDSTGKWLKQLGDGSRLDSEISSVSD